MTSTPDKLSSVVTQFLQLALIILGPLVVFVVASFAISKYAYNDINNSVEHANTEVDLLLPVMTMVSRSVMSATSYVITGKQLERKNFDDSVHKTNKAMTRLADHMHEHEQQHKQYHDIEAELAQGYAHEFEMVPPIQAAWKRVESRARKLMQARTSKNRSLLTREVELLNADAENAVTLLTDLYRKIKYRSRQETRDIIYDFMLFPVLLSAAVGLWLFAMLARILKNQA